MTYARPLVARCLKAVHFARSTGTLRLTAIIMDGPPATVGRTVDVYLPPGDLAFALAHLVKLRPDVFREITAMLNTGDSADGYRQWLTDAIRQRDLRPDRYQCS